MTPFVFDGSFEGFLTAIFDVFDLKCPDAQIISNKYYQPGLLDEPHFVVNDSEKSTRVWNGLRKKLGIDWQKRFYNTFLSESAESHAHLLEFARYIFKNPPGAENNYGHPSVIAISKTDRSVNRERHRMKAFIRFQETSDGIFYAPVEPDYNVLPLIAGFFKSRYADQHWIIYDTRRNYGLYYDLHAVSEITLDEAPELRTPGSLLDDEISSEKEGLFGLLWNDYFKSTNIPARKNMKLHIRHVPKRYWKFLTEKQVPETMFFIAAGFPKSVAEKIVDVQHEVQRLYDSSKALRTEPHITLKAPFRIPQDQQTALIGWFSKQLFQPPFELLLDGFGWFENPENPVIFIKPEKSRALEMLQRSVLDAFALRYQNTNIVETDKAFTPHVTIGFRDLSAENFQKAKTDFQNRSFREKTIISEVTLYRHDGSKWVVEAKNALR